MDTIKYDKLADGTRLSKLQLRAVFRLMGHENVPPADTLIQLPDCFLFWTYTLLTRLKFLTRDQQELLFEKMLPRLKETDTASDLEQAERAWLLVVADGRYATWEDYEGWLDLEIGERIILCEYIPLEAVSFSLDEMFRRNLAAMNKAAAQET